MSYSAGKTLKYDTKKMILFSTNNQNILHIVIYKLSMSKQQQLVSTQWVIASAKCATSVNEDLYIPSFSTMFHKVDNSIENTNESKPDL